MHRNEKLAFPVRAVLRGVSVNARFSKSRFPHVNRRLSPSRKPEYAPSKMTPFPVGGRRGLDKLGDLIQRERALLAPVIMGWQVIDSGGGIVQNEPLAHGSI